MERIVEKAKEELEILEAQYPDRFDYLKLELKSFISLHQSHLYLPPLPSTSSATTQASTNMKRKRVCLERRCGKKIRKPRDRVDVLLQKAHACLRKIHEFKSTLDC